MGKPSRRELNASKYKKFVGNKSEGKIIKTNFALLQVACIFS